jgi:cathepsin L
LKNQRNRRFKIKGYANIPAGDEQYLKRIVATYGPVTVAIDGSDYNFAYYSGGIYYSSKCTTYISNHAVLVVGYGSENGADYWIVKNR